MTLSWDPVKGTRPLGGSGARAGGRAQSTVHPSTIGAPGPRIIGWREYVELPSLGGFQIKAKVDTGARTSALCASGIRYFDGESGTMVEFSIGGLETAAPVVAGLVGHRFVRSSNGHDELRTVIAVPMKLGGETWMIETTLSDRELMGFPMLIGRSALRNRFIVDPNRSYCVGP